MKGLRRVVIGSIAGSLLGAAAYFAVEGLMPAGSEAQIGNSVRKGYYQQSVLIGNGYGF